jgi:hypothetical protein
LAPPSEPSDDELVAYAGSLLQNLAPHLRERAVLEDSVRQQRASWVLLFEAGTALQGLTAPAEHETAAD